VQLENAADYKRQETKKEKLVIAAAFGGAAAEFLMLSARVAHASQCEPGEYFLQPGMLCIPNGESLPNMNPTSGEARGRTEPMGEGVDLQRLVRTGGVVVLDPFV
jgi:hypothetical protein